MATPVGTNELTSLSRRHIVPKIVDATYNSNPVTFRLKERGRVIEGGYQIEQPIMYAENTSGGWYNGYDTINVAPVDTVKNIAFDWKQLAVPVTISGLAAIQASSPEAVANVITTKFEQAKMQAAENLGDGMFSDGTSNRIDGLKTAVDDTTVSATYGGVARSGNTYLNCQHDSTSATLTLTALNSHYGNVQEGGRAPTLIVSRQEQYNRYWSLLQAQQRYPIGEDSNLRANGGWSNLLFNGTPWVVDSHVPDGPNTSNSMIMFLNEDYLQVYVAKSRNFALDDFQRPHDQDAYVSILWWAGNLVCSNPSRQGKMTAIAA